MTKNILILILLIFAACSPVKKYQSTPEVQGWEDDIRKFEQLDETEKYPGNSILFTGSSSIRLWSTLEKDMAPYNVIQRGFGGSKLSDFAVYARRIVDPHPCSAVVIFIANDITGSENDKTPAEVAALFKYSLSLIRKTHPSTPVFWIEVTPTPLRWKAWPKIREANSMIQDFCRKHENTYFISTSTEFLNPEGTPIRQYFRDDKLHLNEEGYKVWSGIIKNEISKVVPYPEVEIIGHRGASYIAPENTVASANLAWKLGADAVECDIYLSSDGRIMVSHDANTRRMSGQNHIIKETPSVELRKLDVGGIKSEIYKGEKMPFLEELIQTVPSGKELVVEIKCGPEVIPQLQKTVKESSRDIKFTFIGFDFNTISKAKEAFSENPCYWLCSDSALFQKNIGLVKGAGLNGVSLGNKIINLKTVAQVKDLGLELFAWTVDDPVEAKRLVALGVKGITTNRPDVIREALYGK
ncbi:MAG TPA: glycerophosphodiester phosphodiesterase family protein [Bacteroidales bacterium]|jgi:glycerophosphoryl diester phosphodiesterase|nr:glycerophosphodiester phosphodiesterase family protein [Bacteroidales bacterium]